MTQPNNNVAKEVAKKILNDPKNLEALRVTNAELKDPKQNAGLRNLIEATKSYQGVPPQNK